MKAFLLLSLTALSGTLAMAQAPFGLNTKQYTSGAVGLAPGQTAKLNVVYPRLPAPLAAQVLCAASIAISDDRGVPLASMDLPVLSGGTSTSLDFNADTQAPGRGRIQIHGLASTAGCAIVTTLEIVDNATQKTVLVLDGKLTFPLKPTPSMLAAW